MQHIVKNYAPLLPEQTYDPIVVHSYLHPIYIYIYIYMKTVKEGSRLYHLKGLE